MRTFFALVVCAVAACLVFTTPARAQDRGFGLGLVAGEPTGITGKLWIGDHSALDMGFGLSIGGDRLTSNAGNTWTRFHLHADYLYHFFDVIHSNLRLPLYFGAGPRLNFGGGYGASFGIRGVAGIDWQLDHAPFDVFVEVAPAFQVGYDVGVAVEGGVGVRYFF